jgi:hypothetical protein
VSDIKRSDIDIRDMPTEVIDTEEVKTRVADQKILEGIVQGTQAQKYLNVTPFQVLYRTEEGSWYRNIGEDDHENRDFFPVGASDLEYCLSRSFAFVQISTLKTSEGQVTKYGVFRNGR